MKTSKLLLILFATTGLTGLAVVASPVNAADAVASTGASAAMESIIVTAPRQETIARERQKLSATILNVQSAETIAKFPDFNAAEALARVPGISLSSDTGEGRFINIRGIDANLNGATYGGVVLLNTFPAGTAASGSGRAVEFDTIPTGAIDGIVVYKTLAPDREAEGLGGQIDLTPRSAKSTIRPFIEADLGWGYEPLHNHTGPFNASLAAGIRFGFNNGKLVLAGSGQEVPVGSGWMTNPTPFSLVVTASRKDDRRAVDDIEPSYANDGATAVDNVFGRVDFRRYDYHRRRFGFGGEFNFDPNDDHGYYVRADVAGYREGVHKNHFYANFAGNPIPNPADPSGSVIDTFQPQAYQVNAQETHRNTVLTFGGKDRFNDLVIDYRAAYSRATYTEDLYKESRWFGAGGFYGTYNNVANSQIIPFKFYNDAGLTTPFNSVDATQYNKPRLAQFYENDRDEEYSGAINAKFPLHLFGDAGELKFGGGIRMRSKMVDDFGGFARPTANLGDYSASVGACCNYYGGLYPNGPFANIYAINALFVANIPTLPPSIGRDFKDQENVYAGYVMYTTTIGKLGVLAGVRVEDTQATYGNFLTITDSSGNSTVSFVYNRRSYLNAFPTVQFKYAATDQLQIRATYSTGIARPGFTQAGGNAGVDFTTSPRPQYAAGNPNLKPITGNNFDVDVEYYLPNGGIIQVGAFDKEFKNYIFRHARINVSDPIFLGQAGDFISYDNESAYARGIEAAFHQKFSTLPGLLGGLGLDANVTLVKSSFLEYDSSVSPSGKAQYGSLPGTSKITWNLSGFYEAHGLQLRLATEYVGHSLFGLNGDQSLDTIQDNRLNLDFTSSYKFTHNLTGYFNVKNLLDTPLRYYEGATNRPIQREIYGQTYEFGIRARF